MYYNIRRISGDSTKKRSTFVEENMAFTKTGSTDPGCGRNIQRLDVLWSMGIRAFDLWPVLSAQTTDKSVNKISDALFEKYPTPQALAQAQQEDVIDIIRTIGMYKTKSKNIIALTKGLVENYGGEVPGDYEELIQLPGVGRKTANVVLAEGFGQQKIAVDTHVFRVTNRIGLVKEKDVLKASWPS